MNGGRQLAGQPSFDFVSAGKTTEENRMDFQQLEVLEDKIKRMVSAMRALKSENDLLMTKNDESEKAIQRLKLDLDKWAKSAEQNDELQQQIEELKRERDEIRNKLERLILNLEELEAKI